jgi:hypothetical protein
MYIVGMMITKAERKGDEMTDLERKEQKEATLEVMESGLTLLDYLESDKVYETGNTLSFVSLKLGKIKMYADAAEKYVKDIVNGYAETLDSKLRLYHQTYETKVLSDMEATVASLLSDLDCNDWNDYEDYENEVDDDEDGAF